MTDRKAENKMDLSNIIDLTGSDEEGTSDNYAGTGNAHQSGTGATYYIGMSTGDGVGKAKLSPFDDNIRKSFAKATISEDSMQAQAATGQSGPSKLSSFESNIRGIFPNEGNSEQQGGKNKEGAFEQNIKGTFADQGTCEQQGGKKKGATFEENIKRGFAKQAKSAATDSQQSKAGQSGKPNERTSDDGVMTANKYAAMFGCKHCSMYTHIHISICLPTLATLPLTKKQR